MSNELVVFQEDSGLEMAPQFQTAVAQGLRDDLSHGVGGGFAIVSIRAGKFRIKHQGNEIPITDDKGDPVGSIEVVLLRANPHLTKQYYEKAFEEGDSSAPTCYSLDGVRPSAAVEKPQAALCATCPKNAFGSRITPAGKKAKACQDNRKMAIVPLGDLRNEVFGGPMLFRVPPSALKDLAQFGDAWKARGFPYNAIGTRIGFDMDTSYPKPTFRAIRPLTGDEAEIVLELTGSDAVEKILADFDAPLTVEELTVVAAAPFEEVETPAPVVAPPAPPPPPAPAPKPAATFGGARPGGVYPAAGTKAAGGTAGFAPKATLAAKAAATPPAAPKGRAKVAAPPVAAPAAPAAVVEAGPAEPADLGDDINSILKELNATAE